MTATVADTAIGPVRATRRDWIGLAILALPCILYSMDLTVLNLAVPQLSAALRPSSAELLWIVDIYGFVLAGALIPMGALGDRIGRRRLLLIGAVAFGAASILAAFSQSVGMLIAARALLGLAAATLAPSTLSLISNMFRDPRERTLAIGIWIASFSSGGAIGPLLGGVMLEYFWWGSVFLLNVPVMILLLATGPWLLPEFRDPDAGRPDLASAAMSLVAVLAIIFGIKTMAGDGIGVGSAAAIFAGLAVGALFLRRQRSLKDPFIDLALFRRPAFNIALAVNIFGFFVAFGSFLLIAQYLQLVIGLSPLEAGLWSAPSGLGFVAGALATPRIVAHVRPPHVMAAGLALASASFVLLASVGGEGDLARVVIGYTLMSVGLAPVFTLTTDLILAAAPPERAGAASGIAETSTEFGGALGIAVLGSLVTALYRTTMSSEPMDDLSPAAAEAARDTLGGVLPLAEQLPPDRSAELTGAAINAFATAFQGAALTSAAITLVAAICAALFLTRLTPSGGAIDVTNSIGQ